MSVITHSLIHSLGLARDVQRSRPVQHTIIIIIIISMRLNETVLISVRFNFYKLMTNDL